MEKHLLGELMQFVDNELDEIINQFYLTLTSYILTFDEVTFKELCFVANKCAERTGAERRAPFANTNYMESVNRLKEGELSEWGNFLTILHCRRILTVEEMAYVIDRSPFKGHFLIFGSLPCGYYFKDGKISVNAIFQNIDVGGNCDKQNNFIIYKPMIEDCEEKLIICDALHANWLANR
jgi:hypothetical protein